MDLENKDFTSLAEGVGQPDIDRARSLVMKMTDSEEKARLVELVEGAERLYSQDLAERENLDTRLDDHIDSYSRSVERFAAIIEEYKIRELN